jgi:glycosyltransferase involved in cell wall biosynthesis
VQSVLRQDAQDWQLVVSDNRSEADVEGYLRSLADDRVVYRRTERLVPVTENWNRALAHSDGEYVLMLGDDDALLPGYIARMQQLILDFNKPDMIYTKALQFVYPGVDPEHPRGRVMENGCAPFFAHANAPFLLDQGRAHELVREAMSFRFRYDFNAQFALFSRRLITSLAAYGDFYQSDFPDYYSMNAAFLCARSIVIDPAPRVVIGVTPKSYGYFHTNNLDEVGREYLNGRRAADAGGSNMNAGWLSAVTALEQGIGAKFDLHVDHRRYRFLQASHAHQLYRAGTIGRGELKLMERELPLAERLLYRTASAALAVVHRVLPRSLKARLASAAVHQVSPLPKVSPEILRGQYRDVLELLDAYAADLPDRRPIAMSDADISRS